jgi:predicted nucleic acid-binding protein
MAILIDADVLLQSERGLFDLQHWLSSQPAEEFKLAAITFAELWHGAEKSTGPLLAKRRLFLRRVSESFEFVPFTSETAIEYARLWGELDSTRQQIAVHDLILAATALQTGYAVATFNKRRFAMVKGLNIVEPA